MEVAARPAAALAVRTRTAVTELAAEKSEVVAAKAVLTALLAAAAQLPLPLKVSPEVTETKTYVEEAESTLRLELVKVL